MHEGCIHRSKANLLMNGSPIALLTPGQSLAREAGKGWATSPAAAHVAGLAKTADLFARSRTALRHPPLWQQNHAWQRYGQGGLEFGEKKP
jgi:hypothetical protein